MAIRASFLLSISYFLGGIVTTPLELTFMRMFQGFASGLWPMELAIMTTYAPPKKLGICLKKKMSCKGPSQPAASSAPSLAAS